MTNPTPHGQVPEALRLADEISKAGAFPAYPRAPYEAAAAELRRLHAENEALRKAHVQNPAEIEHVANDVSKNGAKSNTSQQPAPAGATVDEGFLRSVVMLCNNKGASPESIENFDSDDKWVADLWRLAEQGLRKAPQQPAPATQQAGDVVAYLDVGAGGYLDLEAALSDEALQQLPKGRHALVIAGTYGIDGYVAAPQPAPATQQAADSVLEDAARWQALPAFFEEHQIDAMKLCRDIDAYLAAARKQGGA